MSLAKFALLGSLTLVAAVAGAAAWPDGETPPAQSPGKLAKVTYGTLTRELRFRGTVEYVRSAEIVAPARGILTQIGASLGGTVREGSAIAHVAAEADATGGSADAWLGSFYPSQHEALEAERQALLGRHDTERAALQAKRAALTSLEDYPDKPSDLQVANRQYRELDLRHRAERAAITARLASLEQQRRDMMAQRSAGGPTAGGANVVRAPFTGVVTALSVPPDNRHVELGQHMLTIVDDSALTVAISVAPDATYTLSKQGRAICFLPRRQIRTGCTLQGIVREASGYTARYRIEGATDHAFGEPGEVVLQVGSPYQGLRVPRAALRYRAAGLTVQVIRAGRPVEVGVRIVFEGNLEAIVAGNLRAGETVIIDG